VTFVYLLDHQIWIVDTFRQKLSVVLRIHIDLIVREWLGTGIESITQKKGKYSERQVLTIDIFYLKKSDIDDCFVFL
jgi:hypothetical protein